MDARIEYWHLSASRTHKALGPLYKYVSWIHTHPTSIEGNKTFFIAFGHGFGGRFGGLSSIAVVWWYGGQRGGTKFIV